MLSSERSIDNYNASASNDNACVYIDDIITFIHVDSDSQGHALCKNSEEEK